MNTKPKPRTSDSFRPASYWQDNDPLAAILRNIKGTNRRQITTVSSEFHPDLFDHCDAVHERWVAENTPAEEDEEE